MLKEMLRDSRVFGGLYQRVRTKRIRYHLQKSGLKSLEEVNEYLKRAGIVSFADFGTLLGIVRNGNLLKHDLDMDVGVLITSDKSYETIIDVFDRLGYKCVRRFTVNGELKEFSFSKNSVKVDIQCYYPDDDPNLMFCYLFYNPGDDRKNTEWKSVIKRCPLVKKVKSVPINGSNISIPDNAEDILSYKYGENWRIPDKGWVYWEGPNTYPSNEIGHLEATYLKEN